MSLTGSTNEEKIWNFLIGKGLNAYGAAGLMGNLYAESALNPKNLQNSYESKLGYTDDSYTAAVDSGAYTNFAGDSAGYGLAQWTYSTRKKGLLEYAQAAGASVGDLETQLGYLYKELSESYKTVLTVLKSATSVLATSNSVLTKFECPADQSSTVQTKRAGYGQTYYDKYAENGGTTMTEKELRQKVADTAIKYLGCKESDGSHKQIIDIYNGHSPLARGYKVQYTDAWCATYVSAVSILVGITDIMPTECGCENMITLYKNLGRWKEDDSYTPGIGDVIFYDWDDSGSGDCTGGADHVGIVTAISGTSMTIIEGNKSDAVGYRSMTVNGKYIRGYGLPNYASKATSSSSSGSTGTSTSTGSSTSSDTGTAYSVGDIVTFTGTTHYTSAAAASGKTCKPGTAKVTQISKGAKHPYHLVAESGGGSTVYGWVDAADISGLVSYEVGDIVQFAGGKHYTSANAASGTTVKAGPAKITQIYSGGKHPYHIIHTDSTSTVYGWVDAADIGAASSGSTSSGSSGTTTHTVVKGDTLSALASKYGTTVAKIVAANKSKYSKITANYIVVGWVLTIPQ